MVVDIMRGAWWSIIAPTCGTIFIGGILIKFIIDEMKYRKRWKEWEARLNSFK
jgi:hypothetical protein